MTSDIERYQRGREVLPYGYHKVKDNLDVAQTVLMGAVTALSYLERSRDPQAGITTARVVDEVLSSLTSGDCAVGLDTIESLGMRKTAGSPKASSRREREISKDIFGDSAEVVQTVFEAKQEGNALVGLRRGDHLGYPIELGKYWYLVFIGTRDGAHYYAPVRGIKNITLKPYDAFSM